MIGGGQGGARCAVIGLGEAGGRYAAALVDAGHPVIGFDPGPVSTPQGVDRVGTAAEAVHRADIVLVLTGAKTASSVAESCYEALEPGTCYADFTSSSPAAMRDIARLVEQTGAVFCDVAILGPVSWHGAQTPLMVAGRGAPRIAELANSWGAPVELVDGVPGSAVGHKLIRSVLMKGLAAVVNEAVAAGAAAGYEPWIRDQVAVQLAGDGHAVIERFLTGTGMHAERRAQEMHDTAQYLAELGTPAEMTRAAESALRRIAAQPTPSDQPAEAARRP
jgi:3-hydroxyisobutyrate dehydrogenase-like beta-hydroxyacid dehydrogenase